MAMMQATTAEYTRIIKKYEDVLTDRHIESCKISVMQSYIEGTLLAQASYDMTSGIMKVKHSVNLHLLHSNNG